MRRKQLLGAWTLVLLTTLSLPLNAQPVSSETKSQENEATAIEDNQEPVNAQDLPADPKQAGRPSLDYVPSEAISEDRSVSFPVDI